MKLQAKILPLRLHVDQDALDFIKKFFAFSDPDQAPAPPSEPDPSKETFFRKAFYIRCFNIELTSFLTQNMWTSSPSI